MELDEAVLARRAVLPMLKNKQERIERLVVVLFKGKTLTPEKVIELRAEWEAVSNLLAEIGLKVETVKE